MNARATAIYQSVLDRSGEISPYTDAGAFWKDVKTVKDAIEAGRKEKSLVPSQVVFINMLMIAAKKWAIAALPHNAQKTTAMIYVEHGLGTTGKGHFIYGRKQIGGFQNYGKLVLELEKRVAAGSLSPHVMPNRIGDIMVKPLRNLSIEEQIQVIMSIGGPLTAASLMTAVSSQPRTTIVDITPADAMIKRISDMQKTAGYCRHFWEEGGFEEVYTKYMEDKYGVDAAPEDAMIVDAAPEDAMIVDAVPNDAMIVDAVPADATPLEPVREDAPPILVDAAPAPAMLADATPLETLPADAMCTLAPDIVDKLLNAAFADTTFASVSVSADVVHGSNQLSIRVDVRRT